jgi:hypothetical protein
MKSYWRCLQIVMLMTGFLIFSMANSASRDSNPLRFTSKPDTKPQAARFVESQLVPAVPFDSLTIPLVKRGKLLLLEALIDGQSGYLVFDTGANGLVLNRTYFRNHVTLGTKTSNGITGNVDEVDRVMADKIEIASLAFNSTQADRTDLGHIEMRTGVRILGLFGFSLIRGYEIIIDAAQGGLQLNRMDKKGKSVSVFSADVWQKIDILGHIAVVKAEISHKKLRFCFDTGAEINAIHNYSSNTVLKTIEINRRIKLRGAGADKREVLYGTMTDFAIGNRQLVGMETIITDLSALREAYNSSIDGMLGSGFLEKGVFCFNFVKSEVGIRFTNTGKQ